MRTSARRRTLGRMDSQPESAAMQLPPGSMQQGDPRFGQRLTTSVDLHKLGAPPDVQVGLEALRGHIQAGRERAIRGLFVGAPDSGRALAAASLGKAVGKAVFRIDLSAVVSRHVGETEKNLDRILAEAASAARCTTRTTAMPTSRRRTFCRSSRRTPDR